MIEMNTITAVIFGAAILAANPVQAVASKQFQYYGFPGYDSCGSWTSNRRDRGSQALEGFVLGFVTSANLYGDNDGLLGTGSGATGMLAWVDKYCADNPLDSVLTASIKLVTELKKRRGL